MSFTRYRSLKGRTVIITGGASGIGASFVRAFVENGAKVAFLDLQRETGAALSDSLVEGASRPLFVPCDLTDTAALRAALGEAAGRVPIASVLGQTGESMMSPGLRVAAALYALERQALPGAALCQEPDPEAALPGLCLVPQAARVETVLVPTFAQGGGNSALVFTR